MVAIIGRRVDVTANAHLGQTLDHYLLRMNGNTNWTLRDNLNWLCDRIIENETFRIVSDAGVLFDAAGNPVGNFTFGLEMMVLLTGGYHLQERLDGDWELVPGNLEGRMRAINYIHDHLAGDVNLAISVNQFWQHNADLRAYLREELGEMWIAQYQQPDDD